MECDRIVRLQNSFLLIIELAIADENSHPSRRDERAMIGREGVDRAGEADPIVWTFKTAST